MTAEKRYLIVFVSLFVATLSVVVALNLQLGERALGGAEVMRAASAWQQQTRGVTYPPPTTRTRPFKVLRLVDRLPDINGVVLGSSTGMGITADLVPAPLAVYNFTSTANSTAAIIAEAEYLSTAQADRIRWMLVGLDWSIGMIYDRSPVPELRLTPDAALSPDAAQPVPFHSRLADTLALPRVKNLAAALRAVVRDPDPAAAFRGTFFDMAGKPYACPDGVPARDFDVVNRGRCLGFRYDGSWTFGGEKRLTPSQSAVLARAAAAPSSKFSKFLCMTGGAPNPEYLRRLGRLAANRLAAGAETVFYLPPMVPGMEAALRGVPDVRACLELTLQTLEPWAREHGVTVIDAGASERYGCIAGEFLDEHHAYPECHRRVFARFFADRIAGRTRPGIYRPVPDAV